MSIIDKLFPRKKRKQKKKEYDLDDVDWEDETPPAPLPIKLEKTKHRIPVPKGKALITINRRSWVQIIVGSLLVLANLFFFGTSLMGNVVITEKILVISYTLTTIYVSMKYTWNEIQGEKIEEEDGEN